MRGGRVLFGFFWLAITASVGAAACVAYQQMPALNRTQSVPVGLYWVHPKAPAFVNRGDIVTFRFGSVAPEWALKVHASEIEKNYMKFVIGIPGDQLVQRGPEVWVCRDARCGLAGVRKTRDMKGRPAPWAALPSTIPDGYYFLGSSAKHGFDSRYLGLVRKSQINGYSAPLWQFHSEDLPFSFNHSKESL